MNPHLRVTLVQSDLAWQDPAANRHRLAAHFRGLAGHTDLVVLPEMFSTGFSMDAAGLAEDMDGPTIGWMREEAAAMGCVLAGSLIVREGGRHFNRLVWARPDGTLAHYDKRHLFRMAGEQQHYAAGDRRADGRDQGLARLPDGLLRPALSGLESQSRTTTTCCSTSRTGRRGGRTRGRRCCARAPSRT